MRVLRRDRVRPAVPAGGRSTSARPNSGAAAAAAAARRPRCSTTVSGRRDLAHRALQGASRSPGLALMSVALAAALRAGRGHLAHDRGAVPGRVRVRLRDGLAGPHGRRAERRRPRATSASPPGSANLFRALGGSVGVAVFGALLADEPRPRGRPPHHLPHRRADRGRGPASSRSSCARSRCKGEPHEDRHPRPAAQRRDRRPRLDRSRTSSPAATRGPVPAPARLRRGVLHPRGRARRSRSATSWSRRAPASSRSRRATCAHTFTNRSEAAARYLLVCTPAGFERYFARMARATGRAARVGAAADPGRRARRAADPAMRPIEQYRYASRGTSGGPSTHPRCSRARGTHRYRVRSEEPQLHHVKRTDHCQPTPKRPAPAPVGSRPRSGP